MLLVGEANDPRHVIAQHGDSARDGDFYYSRLDGGDLYPEVGVARLSPQGGVPVDTITMLASLDSMIGKILRYEKGPPSQAGWLDKMLFVAHRKTEPLNYKQLARDVVSMSGYDYWDPLRNAVPGDSHGNSEVSAALNSGTGVLTYCGHGGPPCWFQWANPPSEENWDSANVYALTNGDMTPVVFNLACDCGAIQASGENSRNCLAEVWLRSSPGGAVAALGATGSIYNAAAGQCTALVRALCDTFTIVGPPTCRGPVFDLGSILMYMDAYLLKYWNHPGDSTVANLERTLMLGDPTMPVWAGGMPEVPTVTYPGRVPFDTTISVTVTVQGRAVSGARVCISRPPDLYYPATTDSTGTAILVVNAESSGLAMLVVSEGHAVSSPHTPIRPFQASVSIDTCGWFECEQLPSPPSGKTVKDGGWLAYDPGNGTIFAAKGRKTSDFYAYNPSQGNWCYKLTWLIPKGVENKLPHKGSKGVCDGHGHLFMTKGNNTCGFWRFDIAGDSWHQAAGVPPGWSHRKVKGGTDMAYVTKGDTGFVYLLKGYRNEFWRYNTITDSWAAMPDVPMLVGRTLKQGSWLVFDGDHTIYAHKAKYHELHAFDVNSETWLTSPLTGMPFVNGRGESRQSKDGGSAAWLNEQVWALKGGNNNELWKYCPESDSWLELDTMPTFGSSGRRVRPRCGADLAAAPGWGLYALKGNKCNELWRYLPREGGSYGSGMLVSRGTAPKTTPPTDDGESPLLDGFDASRPRWNALGTWCTYTRTDSLGFESVFMYPKGGAAGEVQLTHGLDCSDPVFSPNGMWIAFGVDDDSVTEREQIAKVLAVPAPTPAIMLTQEPTDFRLPEWSPEGLWLCAERDDPLTGYTQICRIPANGGPAQVLTQDAADHEEPTWFNPFELCYLLSPNGEYSQVARYNLLNQQQTVLSSLPTDHEHPSAAYGTAAVFEVMDDGGTVQIGRVQAGGGAELTLTNGISDMSEPDASQDGFSIYCARWLGLTSEIGWVNGNTGQYQALTDGSAIRDNPDANWDPIFQVNHVIYERLDTSQVSDFGPQKPRKGTGIFYARHRPRRDGVMGAGLGVLALHKAVPNPFRSRVTIHWSVPKLQEASLRIYNTAGQQVRTLAQGPQKPGAYATVWNGTDHKGRRLAAGVYFYTLETGDKRLSRKVVLAE